MQDKDLIQQLRIEIEDVLQECDATITPKLCEFRSTTEGHRKIVDMVVQLIVKQGFTIGSAMQHIERTFNDNQAND